LEDFNSKGKKMNKSELVEAIANGSGITKAAAGRVLDVFMTTITEALKNGDQVVLPGFGSFKTRLRSAYSGRNPQTGKEIQIKAARVANFKAGKNLKEAVQDVR
jgi:DNA-binding protein HU-beta